MTKSTDPVRSLDAPATYERSDTTFVPPYTTPVPSPSVSGQNGFRWCDTCGVVVEVAGHECATALPRGECWTVGCRNLSEYEATGHGAANFCASCRATDRGEAFGWVKKPWGHRETLARAEFAESLLCAMAFDHMTDLLEFSADMDGRDHRRLGLRLHDSRCVFCDCARDGGKDT